MQRILFLLIFSLTLQLHYSHSGWLQIPSGTTYNISQISFLNSNTGYILDGGNSIFKTTNCGVNWILLSTLVNVNSFQFLNDTLGFAVGINMTVLKTVNGGINWTIIHTGPNNTSFYSLYFLDEFTGYVGGASHVLLKTTDGINFANVNNSFSGTVGKMSFINSTAGCVKINNNEYIWYTSNGGTTWIPALGHSYPIQDMFFQNPFTGFAIIAVGPYSYYLCKTYSGGYPWSSWGFDIPPNPITLNAICFYDSFIGYAVGSSGQIICTTNGGTVWTYQNSGTTNYLNSILFVAPNTGFAVGNGGMILKTTDGGNPVGLQSLSNELPLHYGLSQNYPNPFNPSTKIKFDISKSSNAEIKIYNILGNEVADLMHEQLNPGSYEVEWDASSFASGLYFYKLVAGDFVETKKMVLLK